ncbi:MAG: PIN domain-containing protein, partial [Actinomycetota bacterium]|nr:PIN domain-containing protein [Actinomycetota bacterium]
MELADTSAWTNRHKSEDVDDDFSTRILANEIATCPMVTMELLWTAQSPPDYDELLVDLGALPQVPINDDVWLRATEVWRELVARGRHRQVKIPDLLVAAAAEREGLAVCHYDRDFE